MPGLLCDPWIWHEQVSALGAVREVRTPSFLGFDSITGMARSVLDSASGELAIAGHSMGGRVALEIARLAPERVSRLALLDTGIAPLGAGEPARRQAMVDLAYREGMAALAAHWLPPMLHPDRSGDSELMRQLTAMVCRATPELHEMQIRALLGRPDASAVLAAIKSPILIACGRQDMWSPLAQHEAMAHLVPHAKFSVIEDCGHMSTLEAPSAVSDLLFDWLNARL